MKNKTLRFALQFVLAVFAFTATSSAIEQAQLSGILTDPSGARLARVRIAATPENARGASGSMSISADDGTYLLALVPGHYRVKFSKDAFVSREIAVDLAAGETRQLDLRLELERLSSSVIVTAHAEPVPSANTPVPVTVIGRTEIEQRQSVSLPDLLASQTGVSLARTGAFGGLATIFIDGGNSNFTKVLIDGAPANEPGGFFNFSSLTLDNVDKVEIVHGAESALYGSDAVSGVVQVFTHRGTTRVPELNLFAEGGGFSSARGGAQLSGLVGRFDYSAAGSYFQTDGQGPNNAFLNRTLSGNFGWHFSESHQLRLTVRSNSSHAGIPGPTLLSPPNLNQNDSLKTLAANLAWEFRTGSHWQHRLSASESRLRDVNANLPFFTSTDHFNRAGFQEQSTYFFRQGSATAGYQYEVENGFPSLLFGQHGRRNNQAGYLDARWQPVPRLVLSAGARAEANESFGTRVVPRVGVSYAIRYGHGFWGDTRLRASYGQGIKEPALEQSFGNDPCFPGNPALHPERSRTVSAGVEQNFAEDRVRVSAAYFNNRYEDMISFGFGAATPACSFGSGTYFNTDLARARGVNFSVETKLARWLTLAGNYSYDDTRVLKAPNAFFNVSLPGNRLLRRPLHSGNIFLYSAFHRFTWSFAGYFTGQRADSDFLGAGDLIPNPGYARFDVATSYDLGRGVNLYGRVANQFDKQYQDALGYPALGRDFRVGMKFRLGGSR